MTSKKFYEKYLDKPFPNGVNFGKDLNANSKKDMLKYYLEHKKVTMIENLTKYAPEQKQTEIWEKVIKLYEDNDDIKEHVINLITKSVETFEEEFYQKRKEKIDAYYTKTENVEDSFYKKGIEELKKKFADGLNKKKIEIKVTQVPLKKRQTDFNLGDQCKFNIQKQYTLTKESTYDNMEIERLDNIAVSENNQLLRGQYQLKKI